MLKRSRRSMTWIKSWKNCKTTKWDYTSMKISCWISRVICYNVRSKRKDRAEKGRIWEYRISSVIMHRSFNKWKRRLPSSRSSSRKIIKEKLRRHKSNNRISRNMTRKKLNILMMILKTWLMNCLPRKWKWIQNLCPLSTKRNIFLSKKTRKYYHKIPNQAQITKK